ncbi:MAG: PKD domain-containing protein [Solirubrobacterales bacterium]|nr:PKD domain-containing protein [Solirubrobacterales bacterium]
MTARSLMATAAALAAALALSGPAQANSLSGLIRDVPTVTQPNARVAARSINLPYHGGPVLQSNRSHPIFWEPAGSGLTFEPGYESLIETFLIDVAADSHKTTNVYSLSGQYHDADGPAAYDSTYGGATVATDPLPGNGCTEPPTTGPGWTVCLTDAQLEAEIQHVIAAEHLPTSSRDVYFLITPNGLGSCTDADSSSCALGGSVSGYCGYHSETDAGVLYAIIPYNAVPGHCLSTNPRPNSSPADPTISTISHEHNEMVTDPDGDAWTDAQGNEDGDLCLMQFGSNLGGSGLTAWNESIHGGHFFLQEEWSNADSGCKPRARPDSLWFALARQRPLGRLVSFSAHGSAPQGRLIGFQWFFGDGRMGFGRRVSHTFKLPGSYRVLVRAIDSWGNWAFAGRTIVIRRS